MVLNFIFIFNKFLIKGGYIANYRVKLLMLHNLIGAFKYDNRSPEHCYQINGSH